MKIIKLCRTCWMCPSQWEGIIEGGQMIYIRFRCGTLTVSISDKSTTDILEAVNGSTLLHINIGEEFDGYLEDNDMLEYLNDIDLEYKGEINECE